MSPFYRLRIVREKERNATMHITLLHVRVKPMHGLFPA